MSAEQEEIWCDCSDDEKYNPAKYKKGTWEPKPEDILKIFEEIKTKKVSRRTEYKMRTERNFRAQLYKASLAERAR